LLAYREVCPPAHLGISEFGFSRNPTSRTQKNGKQRFFGKNSVQTLAYYEWRATRIKAFHLPRAQMLALGACMPQPCPSAGRRFAASRSRLNYVHTGSRSGLYSTPIPTCLPCIHPFPSMSHGIAVPREFIGSQFLDTYTKR